MIAHKKKNILESLQVEKWRRHLKKFNDLRIMFLCIKLQRICIYVLVHGTGTWLKTKTEHLFSLGSLGKLITHP